MDLRNLIEIHLDPPRLSKDLDEVGHFARVWSVRQWRRRHMAVLWEAVRGLRPVSLDDFVPPSAPPLSPVVHDGKNSLPVFTHFQKRFCRPSRPEDAGTLVGYNHQPLTPLTGPGYYVAYASHEPGAVDIDYTRTPHEKAAEWPDIVPSSARFGRFVYGGTVDVVRGLSSHVTIGRAKKKQNRRGGGDAWLDAWFVLVRTPDELPAGGVGGGGR